MHTGTHLCVCMHVPSFIASQSCVGFLYTPLSYPSFSQSHPTQHLPPPLLPVLPSPFPPVLPTAPPPPYPALPSGDHTVKIVSCETGQCVRTLEGHRRTPWVVS